MHTGTRTRRHIGSRVARIATALVGVLAFLVVGLQGAPASVASPAALWGTETIAGSSASGPAAPALAVTPDGTKGVLAWFGEVSSTKKVLARGFTVDTNNGNQTWSASTYELASVSSFGDPGQRLEAVISDDGSGVVVGWSEDLTTSPYVTAASITYSGATPTLVWGIPVALVGSLAAGGGFLSLAGSSDATSLLAGWLTGNRSDAWVRGVDVNYAASPPTVTAEVSESRLSTVAVLGGGGLTDIPLEIAMDRGGDDAVVAFIDENIAPGFPEATAVYFDGSSGNWSQVGGPPGFFSADVSQFALQVGSPSSGMGRALWTWIDTTGNIKSAVASLDPANGANWSSTTNVATGADAGLALSMTDGAERAMVVWRDDSTDDLLARSLADPTAALSWSTEQVAYDASVATVPAGPLSTVALNDGAGGASPGTVAVVGTAVGSGGYAARVAVATVDYALPSPQSWSAQVPAGTAATSGANPTAFMSNNGRLVTTSFGAVVPGGTPYEARAVSAQIAEAPGAPVATSGDTQATVTITPPAYPISPTPTSYLVTASPGGATCTVSGASGSCTVTGLTNSTSYTFTSTATWPNSTTSGPSPVSNSVTPAAGPTINTQPANATVIAGATASFSVSATAGSGSLSYQWEVKPDGSSTWSNVSGGSGALTDSYTTPTLAGSDDQSEYRVIVTDGNGSTTSSAATLTVISSPGAPGQPTAVAGDGQATVTVVAPGSGSAPTSYTVTASPGGATCTVSGASGSCTVSGLTNGTSYTFTSTATNSAGTSPASVASAAVTPLAAPGTPGTPTAVVTSTTSSTVTITPPSTGGTPASYLVTAVEDNTKSCTVTAPSTSCEVTGLTSGNSYTFTSTATNVGGTSSASAASASVTLSVPGTPGTPTAVSGPGSATVTVVAPSSGGTVSTYTVTSSPAGGSCTVTVPATSCVVGSLTPGTAYTFSATATNGVGTSGSSPASNSVTPSAAIAPGAPGTPTAIAGDGQAVVTVVAPSSGGAADSYTVTAAPGGATCTLVSSASPLSCTVSGLTNGTSYTFTSTATNSIGTSGASAASSAVTPVAAPGTPGAPSAMVTSTTSSTVTISAPTSGGPPVTYTVTASGGGGQTCTVTAPATSCVVTGLTSGGAYTFTSTATNGTGTSASSAASSSVTLSAPGIPGTPTAVAGTQSATVTIAAPSSGGTVSSYTVTSVPAGGSCVVTVPATSCTVTGLTAGTAYTFTSTATNGIGTSSASAASNSVTPTASGGGGGGGGGSSTPATPTPAPAAPSAAVPTSPVAVPPSVTSGSASVVVGGQSVTPTVTPVNLSGGSVGNAVSVAGPGFQSTVSGPSVGGSVPSGSVTVVPGQPVQTSTSGFAPGARVQLWLMPAGTSLGTVTANASGIVNANVSLPAGTAGGPAAIQINGAFASGGLLSVSVGVTVAGGVAPVPYSSGVLPEVTRGNAIAITPSGQRTDVDVRRTPTGGLRVMDGPSSLVVQATTSNGTRVPVNAQGSIVVENGQFIQARGTNLAPNSELAIWVFSDPVLVGVVFTDAKGSYQASLPVPVGLPVGEHTLQTNGTSRSGERLSVSLGLVMKGPGDSGVGAGASSKKTAKASVFFDRLSTRLDARDKATLKKLVKSVKGTPVQTIVVGYVQGSGSSTNDVSLSRARAISVAGYLRKLGLDGRIVTKSGGVKAGPSSQARRVNVSITYQR